MRCVKNYVHYVHTLEKYTTCMRYDIRYKYIMQIVHAHEIYTAYMRYAMKYVCIM